MSYGRDAKAHREPHSGTSRTMVPNATSPPAVPATEQYRSRVTTQSRGACGCARTERTVRVQKTHAHGERSRFARRWPCEGRVDGRWKVDWTDSSQRWRARELEHRGDGPLAVDPHTPFESPSSRPRPLALSRDETRAPLSVRGQTFCQPRGLLPLKRNGAESDADRASELPCELDAAGCAGARRRSQRGTWCSRTASWR